MGQCTLFNVVRGQVCNQECELIITNFLTVFSLVPWGRQHCQNIGGLNTLHTASVLQLSLQWPITLHRIFYILAWFVQFPAFGKSVKLKSFACCLQNLTHFGHKVSLNYHSYKIRVLKWALHWSNSQQCHSQGKCTLFQKYLLLSPAWAEL